MEKGLWILVMIVMLASCQHDDSRSRQQVKPEPEAVVSDITSDAEQWADSVCRTLTLRQKVAQMFIPSLYAKDDYWTIRKVREYADSCVGGILLLKGDSNGAALLADTLQKSSRIPAFVSIDAEWGLAMRLADAPRFPDNSRINPEVDDQLMYDYGRELARECRQLGINIVLGPVVDVSEPNSFMSRRSFGSDPERVADMAISYARGLEDGDVISVAKHFPGHGSINTDSHKQKGIIERSLNEMDSIDLYPFRRWVEQRLSAIMVGHLAVPSIDSQMIPAAMSKTVITDLLRGDLGFGGLVITDALSMLGAEGRGADDAIIAGADIIIAPVNTDREIKRVVNAVEEGRLTEKEIDVHVRRILFYKYLLDIRIPRRHSVETIHLHSEKADTIAAALSRNPASQK